MPIRSIADEAEERAQAEDKARAEQILQQMQLPEEIIQREVRTGLDSTGDPALWVVLRVGSDFDDDQAATNRLIKAADEVQSKLLASGLSRFPYVNLDQAA